MAVESSKIMRVDIRIPMNIYTQIEGIAEKNEIDFTPTTKPYPNGTLRRDKKGNEIQPKRAVTPVILDLIQLGLRAIAQDEELGETIGDKEITRQSELEKKILNTLEQRLEDLFLDKIEGLISDKLSQILVSDKVESSLGGRVESAPLALALNNDDLDDNTAVQTVEGNISQDEQLEFSLDDTPEDISLDESSLGSLEGLDDNYLDEIDLDADSKKLDETISEVKSNNDIADNSPKENPEDYLSKGLTGTDLAQRFGVDKSLISKNYKKDNFKEWSKAKDPDSYPWEKKDRKFYPIIEG